MKTKEKLLIIFLTILFIITFLSSESMISSLFIKYTDLFFFGFFSLIINIILHHFIFKTLIKHYKNRNVKDFHFCLILFSFLFSLYLPFTHGNIQLELPLFIIFYYLLIKCYNVKLHKLLGDIAIFLNKEKRSYTITSRNCDIKITAKNKKEKEYDIPINDGDTLKITQDSKELMTLKIKK